MNPDKLIYWRRSIEVVSLVAALCVVGIFWQTAPPTVVPAILALLGIALGVGQSPIGNPTSAVKTIRPPPPGRVDTIPCPPPMAPWSEVFHTGDTGRPPAPKDMIIPPPNDAPKGTP